jgi:NADH-quinone oxidoreductase subunit N
MGETAGVSLIAILPELFLVLGAVAVLMVAVTSSSAARWLPWIAGGTVVLAAAGAVVQWLDVENQGVTFAYGDMVIVDHQAVLTRFVLLTVVALALLIGWQYVSGLGTRGGEAVALVLLATVGFMLMSSSIHLVLLFLGLEVGSISLYVLAGLGQQSVRSDEAAMKYFLLGSVASAIFLYGAALIFAGTGSLHYRGLFTFFADGQVIFKDGLLTMGLALLFVGLLFKITAAPFHSWAPDVYQGSPAGIVGFMAASAKVGALVAMLRMVQVPFRELIDTYAQPLAAVAALSVVAGTLYAIVQSDLRRVLAYSGVAHAGFLLMAVAIGAAGSVSLLFYLATYVVMLVASFGIISLVEGPGSAGSALDGYRGLARRSPTLAAFLGVLMLGMSGMPVTSGFIAKFNVFTTVWASDTGLEWVVVVGLLASVAAFFFYLRVIVLMYFEEGEGEAPAVPGPAWAALAVSVTATIVLGVYPGPLLDFITSALT